MKTTAQLPIIGMDIAKSVFQLHIVDPETGEIERLKLKRDRVAAFFANRQRSLVAVEACGGAHHWGRFLQSQGHQVKLLPPKQVRPFVSRDKTDARDAQAIWVAAQQPHIFENFYSNDLLFLLWPLKHLLYYPFFQRQQKIDNKLKKGLIG